MRVRNSISPRVVYHGDRQRRDSNNNMRPRCIWWYTHRCCEFRIKDGGMFFCLLTRIWLYDYIFPANKSTLYGKGPLSFDTDFVAENYYFHFLKIKCNKTHVMVSEKKAIYKYSRFNIVTRQVMIITTAYVYQILICVLCIKPCVIPDSCDCILCIIHFLYSIMWMCFYFGLYGNVGWCLLYNLTVNKV